MHILVVRNNSNAQAIDASLTLAAYLISQGIDFTLVDSTDLAGLEPNDQVEAALAEGTDLAVALGGDGTILRTARHLRNHDVAILAINFGRLGFLANSSEDGVVAACAAALAGDVVQERRTNLRIDVVCEGDADPYDDTYDGAADNPADGRTYFALNELAATRGAGGRIIEFSLDIADAHVADMRGDGLVVATATGSTAYALSAGGPLVAPGYHGLIVVPLAPHTLNARAIVTAESDIVLMELAHDASSDETTLFVDGELVTLDAPVRRVYVQRGPHPTVLLRYRREGFYEHASRVFFQ